MVTAEPYLKFIGKGKKQQHAGDSDAEVEESKARGSVSSFLRSLKWKHTRNIERK